MKYERATSIIRQIARQHRKTPQQVRNDILYAAQEAMHTTDPHAKAVWHIIAPDGVLPSAEELIHMLSLYCAARITEEGHFFLIAWR